jgi:deoxyribose-phosphate aldolase
MDMKMLVEKITRDVLETLKEKEGGSSPAPAGAREPQALSGASSAKKALLIIDSNYSAGYITDLLQRRLAGWELVIIKCGSGSLSSLLSGSIMAKNVLSYDEQVALKTFAGDAMTIFYPVTRPYQLSSIATLRDNEPAVAMILEALSAGFTVTLLNLLERKGNAWEARLDSLMKDLLSMGLAIEGGADVALPVNKDGKVSRCEGEKAECQGCGQCASLVPEKVDAVVEAGADRISKAPGGRSFNRELAAMIDHTLLKPDATKDEVLKLCGEARQYVFASVCINPSFVKLCHEALKGSPVKVCTVIGFPLGATTSVTKALETRDAIANGAEEIDMVINVGALKAGNYEVVERDIEAVVEAASGKIVKVIIEAALLSDEEKVIACKLSKKAGADFVKTSTGFGPGGATANDIALMRQTVGKYMGVKASGGIRDFETAQKMINAGATRIGASASVAIVKGEKSDSKY